MTFCFDIDIFNNGLSLERLAATLEFRPKTSHNRTDRSDDRKNADLGAPWQQAAECGCGDSTGAVTVCRGSRNDGLIAPNAIFAFAGPLSSR